MHNLAFLCCLEKKKISLYACFSFYYFKEKNEKVVTFLTLQVQWRDKKHNKYVTLHTASTASTASRSSTPPKSPASVSTTSTPPKSSSSSSVSTTTTASKPSTTASKPTAAASTTWWKSCEKRKQQKSIPRTHYTHVIVKAPAVHVRFWWIMETPK